MRAPLATLWAFSRPHTLLGTATSVPAIGHFVAGRATGLDALPAALLANVYVVGLNQLVDVKVDALNKPHLPLPSGAMTHREAQGVVGAALTLSLACAAARSKYLLCTCAASMALGTFYSVGGCWRLKRSPEAAALSIVAVRGGLINIGFASHAAGHFVLPRGLVAYFSALALAIALLKDVPDVCGDAACGLPSFARRWGGHDTVIVSAALVLGALLGAMVTLGSSCLSVGALLALWAALSFTRTTLKSSDLPQASTRLYRALWVLWVASYASLWCV